MVNAEATIDLPWLGKVADWSGCRPGKGQLGCLTLEPSTKAPPPPRKEITEAFWVYGDASIIGKSS